MSSPELITYTLIHATHLVDQVIFQTYEGPCIHIVTPSDNRQVHTTLVCAHVDALLYTKGSVFLYSCSKREHME
jgi:hypothetical protein